MSLAPPIFTLIIKSTITKTSALLSVIRRTREHKISKDISRLECPQTNWNKLTFIRHSTVAEYTLFFKCPWNIHQDRPHHTLTN